VVWPLSLVLQLEASQFPVNEIAPV